MSANRPRLLAIGGAHWDRRGRVSGDYIPGTSNPGDMADEAGGAAFNAARAAGGLGAQVALLSVRGGDPAGLRIAEAIATAGLRDLSATFLDRRTPSYTAILDADGGLIAGLADMALYEAAFDKQLRRSRVRDEIARADGVLCDANLPALALRRLAGLARDRSLFAIATSAAKVGRFLDILPMLDLLVATRAEAEALTAETGDPEAQCEALRLAGLRCAIVTDGAGPVHAFRGASLWRVTPPAVQVVDVTGAGDALAGAAIVALTSGHDLVDALRHGVAVASLCVASRLAAPAIGQAEFAAALALVPSPERLA